MGILVWHDFMFACGCYPEEEPIWSLVEQEARELFLALGLRSPVAVRVRHVQHVGNERLERRPQRRATIDRQSADPPTMNVSMRDRARLKGLWTPSVGQPQP